MAVTDRVWVFPEGEQTLAELSTAMVAAGYTVIFTDSDNERLLVETPESLGGSISETEIVLSDNTTGNASTTKHGFLKKLSNNAAQFLNGVGNWVAISAGITNAAGSSVVPKSDGTDLVASRITDDGDAVTVQLGTGAGKTFTVLGGSGDDQASIDVNTSTGQGKVTITGFRGVLLNSEEGNTELGDINFDYNGTKIVINDAAETIALTAANGVLINGVKRYVALLTQTGTDAPVATVLENSLSGPIVWTRNDVGDYLGTLTGAFTANKTWPMLPTPIDGDIAGGAFPKWVRTDNTIQLLYFSSAGDPKDLGVTIAIEIRVYP